MRNHLLVLMSMLSLSTIVYAQQYGSFKDARDGRVYKTVKIGSQVWMAENLNVAKFRNGEVIPEAKTKGEWKAYAAAGEAAWCYYNNDPANGVKYGKLYNWYAVIDSRGLAPVGYHIPSDAEWTALVNYLATPTIFSNNAGAKMKSKQGWASDGNGTNSSGFSGVPGSSRDGDGTFGDVGKLGYWWSSSEAIIGSRGMLSERPVPAAWARSLDYSVGALDRDDFNRQNGFSVRCLRDIAKKYFSYSFTNSCFYNGDDDIELTFWIDNKPFKYGQKIELETGEHKVKEKLYFHTGILAGQTYEDSTTIILFDDNNLDIILELNCACPFFYYAVNSKLILGGELIRNQNNKSKDNFDKTPINIKFIINNTLNIKVSEEKEETSYLDQVYILVNDTLKIFPLVKEDDTKKLLSKVDGQYFKMDKGESYDFYFLIPKNVVPLRAEIFSKGYYLSKHK